MSGTSHNSRLLHGGCATIRRSVASEMRGLGGRGLSLAVTNLLNASSLLKKIWWGTERGGGGGDGD